MKFVKLGQYIIQIRGISYKPKDVITEQLIDYVPIVKSNNIKEDGFSSEGLIYIKSKHIRSEQYIRKGDLVLTASSGSKKTIGKNIQFDNDFNGSFGAFCKLIRPKDNINAKYLYHFFRTRVFRKYIEKVVQGANIANLKNEYIDNLKIPIPETLEDQIRIATILTRAEELIARRKESIRLLDELVKSTFLDMFGDPYFNQKNWKKEKLEKLCNFITKGTTPKNSDIHDKYEEGLIPFLKVYHIMNDGTINFNYKPSFVKLDLHNSFLKRSKVYPNDILMNIVGPPLGKIGIVPDTYSEWNVNQAIVIFRCQGLINSRYLLFTLKNVNYLKLIISSAIGIRQQNLNLLQCRNFEVPVPPIELQNQFASTVEKIESIKTTYRQSLAELENLYGSLSQRAFKGELDLSRVPVEVPNKGYTADTSDDIDLSDESVGYKVSSPTADFASKYYVSEKQNKRKQSDTFEIFANLIKQFIKNAAWFIQSPFSFDELYRQYLHDKQEFPDNWEEYQDEADEYLEETGGSSLLDERDEYEETKAAVYALLKESFLIQVFDEKEKKILLKVNNETDKTETE